MIISASNIEVDPATAAESVTLAKQGAAEDIDKDELMDLIKEDASYLRPTLFAVYGVSKEGNPFLGWGIQFREKEAIFWRPGSGDFSLSTSAEHVLRSYQRYGDARLLWLDDD